MSAVLLVPGSWHGAWCWDEVIDRLAAAGVLALAIDLPSNDGASGLADDAAAVRRALAGLDEPAVVAGHSYGGVAISEGAAGEEVLYGDCDPDVAARAAARLTPQSVAAIATPQSTAAWHEVPSTYVICEQDAAVPPPAQEAMSARASAVHRLPASHSPFFSRPDDVAEIVLGALA